MSPAERHAYDEHLNAIMIQNDVLDNTKLEGIIEGRKEGREEGRKEGQEAERLRNARAMKAEGLPTALIAKITGFGVEDIEKL